MNQAHFEATLEFHMHELGTDDEAQACDRWCAWVKQVELALGHGLDGDQDEDGYSLDLAHDLYCEGLTSAEATAEFRELEAAVPCGNCDGAHDGDEYCADAESLPSGWSS